MPAPAVTLGIASLALVTATLSLHLIRHLRIAPEWAVIAMLNDPFRHATPAASKKHPFQAALRVLERVFFEAVE